MITSNIYIKRILAVFVLGLLTPFISSYNQPTLAQQNTAKTNQNRIVFKPPGEAKPKTTVGGASRDLGQCPEDSVPLKPYVTPVIPVKYQGLTAQARPTIFVYLPAISAQKAFFSIRDIDSNPDNHSQHYQTILPLAQNSGIIRITLPEDAPELEIGKNYQWSFVIMCNNRLRPDSPMVEGTIQRVALSSTLKEQLKTALPIEKVALYGQAGLWYDTISTLAQLRYAAPDNKQLITMWQDLLNSESVELPSIISTQPLLK